MKDAKGHGSDPRGGNANRATTALDMRAEMDRKRGQAPAAHTSGVDAIGKSPFAPSVLDVVRNNPGGFSVTPDGKQPTDGFMVSLPGHTQIVSESDLSGPRGGQILDDYGRAHAGALAQPGAHVGGWTDKESHKTYLDVSQRIPGRDAAVAAGKARNQIAIWDVKGGQEVRTGGTGEQFENRDEHYKVNEPKK